MRVEEQGAFLQAVATANDGGRVQPVFAAIARPIPGAEPARKRASKPAKDSPVNGTSATVFRLTDCS